MRTQLLILSEDAVFARMLELEFCMMEISVCVSSDWQPHLRSEIVLVDLDSVSLLQVEAESAQIIGFTKLFDVSQLDPDRKCSMILHRPFEMRLLREEVTMLLSQDPERGRRSYVPHQSETLQLNGCELSLGDRSITLRQKEAQVMECLLTGGSKPVSREEICRVIGEASANKADVYVCLLRKKLATLSEKQLIRTVRGKGYCVI